MRDGGLQRRKLIRFGGVNVCQAVANASVSLELGAEVAVLDSRRMSALVETTVDSPRYGAPPNFRLWPRVARYSITLSPGTRIDYGICIPAPWLADAGARPD
jgi:hypothetical protein